MRQRPDGLYDSSGEAIKNEAEVYRITNNPGLPELLQGKTVGSEQISNSIDVLVPLAESKSDAFKETQRTISDLKASRVRIKSELASVYAGFGLEN